jgi:hypothetical protein
VLPLFFAVGIIFAPIGGLLLWASTEVGGQRSERCCDICLLKQQVQEISIDYSDCIRRAPAIERDDTGGLSNIPSDRISKTFKGGDFTGAQPAAWGHYNFTADYKTSPQANVFRNVAPINNTNVCRLEFDIENTLKAPVFMYYRMTNFYQNHRRYVKSYDQGQLDGDAKSYSSVDGTDCAPLDVDTDSRKPYYPCGLIANSIFNDTFFPPVLLNSQSGDNQTIYNMTNKGIAWGSDKDLYHKTKYANDAAVPPPNWRKKFPQYNDTLPPPDLGEWEEFFVWMRTAGLPTFSKLALRQDNDNMRPGRYQMDIWDEFNSTLYDGTKSILISTRTVMGGKNPFLGIAYLVVGGLCILLGALFTFMHIVKPRYVLILSV